MFYRTELMTPASHSICLPPAPLRFPASYLGWVNLCVSETFTSPIDAAITIPMLAASASAYSLGGVLPPHICSSSRASALPILSAAYDFALPGLDGSRDRSRRLRGPSVPHGQRGLQVRVDGHKLPRAAGAPRQTAATGACRPRLPVQPVRRTGTW